MRKGYLRKSGVESLFPNSGIRQGLRLAWLGLFFVFATSLRAGNVVDTIAKAGDLASIGTRYSNKTLAASDTLFLRFAIRSGFGSLSLSNFSAAAVVLEPLEPFDSTLALHFTTEFMRMDSVAATVVIRNLNIIADGANPRWIVGNNNYPNGSLLISKVQVSGSSSWPEKFMGWWGDSTSTVTFRQCALVAPAATGIWRFLNLGRFEMSRTLIRVAGQFKVEAYDAVTFQGNTLVACGFDLDGLPTGYSTGVVQVQNNHFVQAGKAATEPINVVSSFALLDPTLQTGNVRAGYSAIFKPGNVTNILETPKDRFTAADGVPDSSETWLWRIPGDTLRGAFASGGLPAWNTRPGETSRIFSPGLPADSGIKLSFAACEVPRKLGLVYAKVTYPQELVYRTRYRSDTALRVTGPVSVTKIQFPDALPVGDNAVLLFGSNPLQIKASSDSSRAVYTWPLDYVEPVVPAAALTRGISRGKNIVFQAGNSGSVQWRFPEVQRAGHVIITADPAKNFTRPNLRLLTLEAGNTAITLSGDFEPKTGDSITLGLKVVKASWPFDADKVELWRQTGGGDPVSLGHCKVDPDSGRSFYRCGWVLPPKAGQPYGDINGAYSLTEKLAVPVGKSAMTPFSSASLNGISMEFTANQGFQFSTSSQFLDSLASPSLAYLSNFSKRALWKWPGREQDSLSKAVLKWTVADSQAQLFRLNSKTGEALLYKGQGRQNGVLSVDLGLHDTDVFFARKYSLPRYLSGEGFDTAFRGFEVKHLQLQNPSDMAIDSFSVSGKKWRTERDIRKALRLSGRGLIVLRPFDMILPAAKDTVDSVYWVRSLGNESEILDSAAANCSGNSCTVKVPKFKDSLCLVMVGKWPTKKPIDTLPPIDTTQKGDTAIDSIPKPPDPQTNPTPDPPKEPEIKVAVRDQAQVLANGTILLIPGIPDSLAKATKSITVTCLTLSPLGGPQAVALKPLKPGDSILLRQGKAWDLGYRLSYLDKKATVLAQSADSLLHQPLNLVMKEMNDTLPKLARLNRHLMGWSLPETSVDSALALWLATPNPAARADSQLELHALKADAWKPWSRNQRVKPGLGLLMASKSELKPRFPDSLPFHGEAISLPLDSGWNLVANPFPFPIAQASIVDTTRLDRFQALNTSEAQPWRQADTLWPFCGYAVFATRRQNLVFDPLKSAAPRAASKTAAADGRAADLLLRIASNVGDEADLRITASPRGAGHLDGMKTQAMEAWFDGGRPYRILPDRDPSATLAELTLRLPGARRVHVTVASLLPDAAAGTGAAWLDKQTGLWRMLEPDAFLDLPAGQWSFQIKTGPPASLRQQLALMQPRGPGRLALAPMGRDRGLWRVGVPPELGYARLRVTVFDGMGRMHWRQALSVSGAGWHAFVLPALPPGVFVSVTAEQADGLRQKITRRVGLAGP